MAEQPPPLVLVAAKSESIRAELLGRLGERGYRVAGAGDGSPAHSWHLARGLTAWHAAGEVHTDIQRGFVRAEVIGWEPLVEAGGYAAARDRGVLRLEGRDYRMADGDVITVKFTP